VPLPPLHSFVEATAGWALDPWQRTMCAALERLRDERGVRLLIHGPPQHGKSAIISQRLPAWLLCADPVRRLRLACYNISHAARFTRVVLELLRDPALAPWRPAGASVPSIAPAEEWSTAARAALRDANPSVKALGLGTGFVGLGADDLLIDDPYKNAQEARSAAVNLALRDWWQQVATPRISAETNVVVMFHRWWEGDFAGWLIEQGGWEVLRFPALADGGPDDPTGRAVGEPLSPRFTREYLAAQRTAMGTAFEALYQGTPYPMEGGLFQAAAQIVRAVPAGVVSRVRYWDKAGANPGKGDYTVGVLLAALPDGRWLVEDVVRFQAHPAERNARIRETAALDTARPGPAPTIYVEQPPGDGVEATQALIGALAGFPAFADPVRGDKIARAEPVAAQWQVGNVLLLAGDWNAPFLEELRAFPAGKHDDQPDALAGAFRMAAAVPMAWAPRDLAALSSGRRV
jgi:predicted phage terminase large subunit-like protein